MTFARKRYWILGRCHTIKAVINTCTAQCATAVETEAILLPKVVAIDLAWSIHRKEKNMEQKTWICLFTCSLKGCTLGGTFVSINGYISLESQVSLEENLHFSLYRLENCAS